MDRQQTTTIPIPSQTLTCVMEEKQPALLSADDDELNELNEQLKDTRTDVHNDFVNELNEQLKDEFVNEPLSSTPPPGLLSPTPIEIWLSTHVLETDPRLESTYLLDKVETKLANRKESVRLLYLFQGKPCWALVETEPVDPVKTEHVDPKELEDCYSPRSIRRYPEQVQLKELQRLIGGGIECINVHRMLTNDFFTADFLVSTPGPFANHQLSLVAYAHEEGMLLKSMPQNQFVPGVYGPIVITVSDITVGVSLGFPSGGSMDHLLPSDFIPSPDAPILELNFSPKPFSSSSPL